MALRSGTLIWSNGKTRRALWCALGTAVLLGRLGAESASAQCHYEVTLVPGPPCGILGPRSVNFLGLNDLGQACGTQLKCDLDNHGDQLPIVWTPELGKILLPLPEGVMRGVAHDINNVLGSDGFGQVACTLSGGTLGGERAFLYDDGVWTMLPPVNGSHSGAFAINDAGQVAGYRDVNGVRHAFVWQGGMVEQIPSPVGGSAIAYGLNEAGATTGLFGTSTAAGIGFIWDGVKVVEIPPLPGGTNSEGRGINIRNVVAGHSRIQVKSGVVPFRSWVFSFGSLVDLGLFDNAFSSFSRDVNDAAQVVGESQTELGFGAGTFLWQNGVLMELHDLFDHPPELDGMSRANAINSSGQIAGVAVDSGAGVGIILTPIDRPLGDVNFDCDVNGDDLALVLADWGPCPGTGSCLCDIVSSRTFQPPPDGVVDGADLAVVLGNWTGGSSTSSGRN